MNELIDFLQKEDVKQFIKENFNADVNQIILNPPAQYKDRIKVIAKQVLARQKAHGKLQSWAQNFDLIMPPPLSIEQASSLATCDYKKNLISGDRLVDLTGGMGVDFLALCDTFAESIYVEQDSTICNAFKHNSKVLGRNVDIFNDEASNFLLKLDTSKKTTIYLDPARRDQQKSKVFKIEDCSPDLIELIPLLKEKANQVLVKYSPLLDLHSILQKVENVKEIHVVSVKNECKELLVLMDFGFEGIPTIHCVNLQSEQDRYDFQMDEERSTEIEFGNLDVYLMEPNSSIMKAGAFKKIAQDFEVDKIAMHTHLYTSSSKKINFPGRVFEVIAEADKKNIREFALDGKINVMTRNYPLTSNDLKKKLKLKDGGRHFLIGFKDKTDKAKLIIAKRVDPLE